jgi:WD40 repeat protein
LAVILCGNKTLPEDSTLVLPHPQLLTISLGSRSLALPDDNDNIKCYTYTPDGTSIIIGSDFGLYRVDTASLQITDEFVGHEDTVWSVSVSADGRTLVSSSLDQTIRFWDLGVAPGKPRLITYEEMQAVNGFTGFKDEIKQIYPSIDLHKPADRDQVY